MKDSYEIDSIIPQNIMWWWNFYKVLTKQLELLVKITLSIENGYFIGRFASLHTPVYGYYVTIGYNKNAEELSQVFRSGKCFGPEIPGKLVPLDQDSLKMLVHTWNNGPSKLHLVQMMLLYDYKTNYICSGCYRNCSYYSYLSYSQSQ